MCRGVMWINTDFLLSRIAHSVLENERESGKRDLSSLKGRVLP